MCGTFLVLEALQQVFNRGGYGRALQNVRKKIRAGRNIDEFLEENIPDFDPLTIDLIRTGRTSGSLANMLLFVGKTLEGETQKLTKKLAGLAEPIAIF